MCLEPQSSAFGACSQTLVKLVEQLLQRHLLFRNSLQERLSAEHWKSLLGDILVQLIGQNDVSSRLAACACACATLNTHLFAERLL